MSNQKSHFVNEGSESENLEPLSEAAPGISPEEVAAIGLFLLARRRETLGVFGAVRYQPLKEYNEHEDNDPR